MRLLCTRHGEAPLGTSSVAHLCGHFDSRGVAAKFLTLDDFGFHDCTRLGQPQGARRQRLPVPGRFKLAVEQRCSSPRKSCSNTEDLCRSASR